MIYRNVSFSLFLVWSAKLATMQYDTPDQAKRISPIHFNIFFHYENNEFVAINTWELSSTE